MTLKACIWKGWLTGYWFVDICPAENVEPDQPVFIRAKSDGGSERFDTHAEAIAWAWEQVAETCPGQG